MTRRQSPSPARSRERANPSPKASNPSSLSEDHLSRILVRCVPLTVIQELADQASKDKRLFGKLVRLSLQPPVERAGKASWAMAKAALLAPQKIVPWQEDILNAISSAPTGGIKRELLKSLLNSQLHEEGSGKLFDLCLQLIDGREDRGVIHYAMVHLEKLTYYFPELRPEVSDAVNLFRNKSGASLPYKIRVYRS